MRLTERDKDTQTSTDTHTHTGTNRHIDTPTNRRNDTIHDVFFTKTSFCGYYSDDVISWLIVSRLGHETMFIWKNQFEADEKQFYQKTVKIITIRSSENSKFDGSSVVCRSRHKSTTNNRAIAAKLSFRIKKIA